MSNEFAYAVVLANRILDRPSGDPDDDLAVLARQFLRASERARDIPRTATGAIHSAGTGKGD
jgi:hypothetical protein